MAHERPGVEVPPWGEPHLFVYSDKGGGAIRPSKPPETPGSIPCVHVSDVDASFATALRQGARERMPPEMVIPSVRIAIVGAPSRVPMGLSGPGE